MEKSRGAFSGENRKLHPSFVKRTLHSVVLRRQNELHSPPSAIHRAHSLLWHVGPVTTDEVDEVLGVENPVTKARIDLEAPAVGGPAVVVSQDGPVTAPHHGVLHIPPRQLRTGKRR